jgi:hypothetical protein
VGLISETLKVSTYPCLASKDESSLLTLPLFLLEFSKINISLEVVLWMPILDTIQVIHGRLYSALYLCYLLAIGGKLVT